MKLLLLGWAIAALVNGVWTQGTCPAGYELQLGASCYTIIGNDGAESQADFAGAAVGCPAGGRLAEINTAAEEAFLQQQVNTVTGNHWFGYDSRSPRAAGDWRLTSSEAVSPFSNWQAAAPANAASRCGQLTFNGVLFSDGDCASVQNYICEFSLAVVTCTASNNEISISVDQTLLAAFGVQQASDLAIGSADPTGTCVVSLSSGNYVAAFAPEECGSTVSYDVNNPDAVVLSSALYHSPSTASSITRTRGELATFDCRVQTVDLLSSNQINPQAIAAQLTQVGFGEFAVGLSLRTANDYATELTANPAQVILGQLVYVQLEVSSAIQSQLDISAISCFGSPSSVHTTVGVQSLALIDADCPSAGLGLAFLPVSSPASRLFHFEFPAFEFIGATGATEPSVYVHCTTRICLSATPGNLCATAACSSRKRRHVEQMARLRRQSPVPEVAPGTSLTTQDTSFGPIQVLGANGQTNSAGSTSPTFYGLLLSMGFLYLAI